MSMSKPGDLCRDVCINAVVVVVLLLLSPLLLVWALGSWMAGMKRDTAILGSAVLYPIVLYLAVSTEEISDSTLKLMLAIGAILLSTAVISVCWDLVISTGSAERVERADIDSMGTDMDRKEWMNPMVILNYTLLMASFVISTIAWYGDPDASGARVWFYVTLLAGPLCTKWVAVTSHGFWLTTMHDLRVAERDVLDLFCSNECEQLHDEASQLAYIKVSDTNNATYANHRKTIKNFGVPKHFIPPSSPAAIDASIGSVPKGRDGKKPNLVILHGYGGSNMVWTSAASELQKDFQVYLVEIIGFGRSTRSDYDLDNPKNTAGDIYNVALEHLEVWRKSVGIDRFVLAGHSIGAHIVAAYALHYPSRVQQILFLSPAGVGLPPVEFQNSLEEGVLEAYERENVHTTEDADDVESIGAISTASDPSFKKQFQLPAVLHWLWGFGWELGFTPMMLVRAFGPPGLYLVRTLFHLRKKWSRVSSRSFLLCMCTEQEMALIRYFYANSSLPPSGEKMLNILTMPFGYARKPLVTWFHGANYTSPPSRGGYLNNQADEGSPLKPSDYGSSGIDRCSCVAADCHVSLIYGDPDVDWMNPRHGHLLCKQLESEGTTTSLEHVSAAGHMLAVENPPEFAFRVRSAVVVAANKLLAQSSA